MPCILKLMGTPYELFPEPQYLVSFDPSLPMGDPNMVKTSKEAADAKLFATSADAFNFWKTTHKTMPKRPDGKPNRPLTFYTVEISKA